MTEVEIKEALFALAKPEKEKVLKGFFKTGEGQYGENDRFIGVTVPDNRKLAKQYPTLSGSVLEALLHDPIHECRLFALLNMAERFVKSSETDKKAFFDMYISNTDYVNNWDLVDLSAYQIVGRYIEDKEHDILYTFAQSGHLWQQRIAIVATWEYIRKGQFEDTLRVADILLTHSHDLIQKAVGWMLREVGKRDKAVLIGFLERNYRKMPRTMLRYAIEKFTPEERAHYMQKG